MSMTDEQRKFREDIFKHANSCVKRKVHCIGEEACKQALILPFISLLGYDIFDVNEVKPEHSADFSDKYKNRVDYAIIKDGEPVIAIECKENIQKVDRGQLKSYFNACKSVKLGILTDGLKYEFFADCDSPNMMDDDPFISFDLTEISMGRIDDEQVKAIFGFKKNEFDPDNVGAEAKKKLVLASVINFLEQNLENPTEDFTRYLLSHAEGINQKITKRIVDENAEVVKSAFSGFIDKRILDRVGLADKRLVKIEEKKDDIPENIQAPQVKSDIITTEGELNAYKYIKLRLAYLVDSDDLYRKVSLLEYRDYRTVFIVYYKKEQKGRLFSLVENADGTKTFNFSLINKEFKVKESDYAQFDEALLEAFQKAISEMDK